MNYYTIEPNIPIPAKAQKHRKSGTKTPIAHYTYMEVGDSVVFPTYNQARSVDNLLRNAGYKSITRMIVRNHAYRVWRIE